MLHLIYGDGKGKTSAAVGMAVRAAGHGMRVLFVQLLKVGTSGEVASLAMLPAVRMVYPAFNYGFTYQMYDKQLAETRAENERLVCEVAMSDADLVIVDEALYAMAADVLDEKAVRLLCDRHGVEIVLTGCEPPEWLLSQADYASKILKVKQPYDRGIKAREGFEW